MLSTSVGVTTVMSVVLPSARHGGPPGMAGKIAPEALKSLLDGSTPFALIDVREAGEYNSSTIRGSSLIPRRQLEFQVPHAVPYKGTHVVVCDDDGRRAGLAAATLERMGYRGVSVLDGGINRWVTDGLSTEWGMNVPSKDFGEKVEVVHHVPEIEATELAARIQKGEKLVILDTRTPEEFRRFCSEAGRGSRRALPGHPRLEERAGPPQRGADLSHRRPHARRVLGGPHPGLPLVPRWSGRAALRRRGCGEEQSNCLRLRSPSARHADRLVVSANGLPRSLRRRWRHDRLGGERGLTGHGLAGRA